MLLVKNERRKRKEFSVKVTACIIGHPFPLKTIMQSKLQTIMNKVSLQTNLERNFSISSYNFLLNIKFKNLTIELRVLYILNTCQISFQSDVIYYSINKLIFCA